MVLLLFGFALIFAGFIILGRQTSSLAKLKLTLGTLVAYESGKSEDEFYPLVSFTYKTDKYFFRNSGPLKSPRLAIGSEQTVYYALEKQPEVGEVPMKAMLSYSGKNVLLPWMLIGLGVYLIWLFAQLDGFFLSFAVLVVALKYAYGWAKNSLGFADFFNYFASENPQHAAMSETFAEEKLKQIPVLDEASLRLCREKWIAKQTTRGFVLAALAIGCLVVAGYSASFETAPRVRVHVKRQPLTAEQVVDAGSAQAAEAKFAEDDGNQICVLFESSSCIYSYRALDDQDSVSALDRFETLIAANTGVLLLLFAFVCFYSRKIFFTHK